MSGGASQEGEQARRAGGQVSEAQLRRRRHRRRVEGAVAGGRDHHPEFCILHLLLIFHILISLHLNVLCICIFCIIAYLKEQLQVDDTISLARKIDTDLSETHIEYESTIQEMLEAEDALFDNLEQRLEKMENQSRLIFKPIS